MKTHTITIDEKNYELRMTGTIGIQILAQSFVPDESERNDTVIDEAGNEKVVPSGKWLMALLYAVFYSCHEKEAEKVDFLKFVMSFNTKEFNEAIEWYFKAYAEREGILATATDENGEQDPKNA